MKTPDVYLRHIRDAIVQIREFTSGGEEEFRSSPMVQAAVIRNLEVIGEAAKQLPQDFREQHSEQPWSEMTGMRDILIRIIDEAKLADATKISVATRRN